MCPPLTKRPPQTPFNRTTTLHMAADKGHAGVVRLLLEAGAQVDPVQDVGASAWGVRRVRGMGLGALGLGALIPAPPPHRLPPLGLHALLEPS